MNTVRWKIVEDLKAETELPVITTYGSMTKTLRKLYCIDKTHANDAFVIGYFHLKHRQKEEVFTKRRRNNRILSKFYDAKYKDLRNGKVRTGKELSSGRTKRCEQRSSEKDLRVFRGHKVKKGRVNVRKKRYAIRPGTIVRYGGKKVSVRGVHCNGTRAVLENGKSVSLKKVSVIRHPGGWVRVS